MLTTSASLSALAHRAAAQEENRQLNRDRSQQTDLSPQRRIALVIGNGAYANAPSLRNPPNDARDMAERLQILGFSVTSGVNVNQRDMKRLIREFGIKLKPGGSGLFYYAGHGVQSKGRNYLIPTEADVQSETDVEDQGVDVNLILGLMDEASNGLNVVILDACRNNPFARSFRSVSNGLAQVDAPTGTLIAYSTAPGRVARDGEGRNGAYTAELLRQMQVPGLTIEELLKRVRANLKKLTNGEQIPWEASSLVGNFYFNVPNSTISEQSNPVNTRREYSEQPPGNLLTNIDTTTLAEKLETTPGVSALQTELRGGPGSYDITNYRVEVQLLPSQQLLRAAADITFVPLTPTRTLVFEINGSLDIESIERDGKLLANSSQDRVGAGVVGPNVRIDLGEVVPADQPITLRFRWHGTLISAVGGPLPNKRLGYVGQEGSYLMYPARWLPFHQYSADRATADMTIIVPSDVQVAGPSDEPVTIKSEGNTTRYRFVFRRSALVGNFVAGKYIVKNLRLGSYELAFYCRPGGEKFVDRFASLIGEALQFYTRKYGPPAFASDLIIAQIDDASLDAYGGAGIIFLSSRAFEGQISDEALLREIATQWWGYTVGLKSFDDAWISQGLAQWSSYAFRESTLRGTALAQAKASLENRARKFAETTTIQRAPSALDDQSPAYQSIVFFKGAVAFGKLREELGAEKFDSLLSLYLRQYRGRNASIRDFENLTNQIAGRNMRSFFAQWLESPGLGIRRSIVR